MSWTEWHSVIGLKYGEVFAKLVAEVIMSALLFISSDMLPHEISPPLILWLWVVVMALSRLVRLVRVVALNLNFT